MKQFIFYLKYSEQHVKLAWVAVEMSDFCILSTMQGQENERNNEKYANIIIFTKSALE